PGNAGPARADTHRPGRPGTDSRRAGARRGLRRRTHDRHGGGWRGLFRRRLDHRGPQGAASAFRNPGLRIQRRQRRGVRSGDHQPATGNGSSTMSLNRRDFIKANAVAAAAATAGMAIPTTVLSAEQAGARNAVRWDKIPCRFCGTGCSVLIGVQNDRVVATQGDPDSPVNRGLNCIKGYFLSKILYGSARLTQPLLRMTNGQYDKNGTFTPVSWDQAYDIMADKWKAALKEQGPDAIAMFGSGQWTIWEGYAASKLFKAGFRSNNLDPNARHCMASAVVGFMRTFGIDEPMGCYDDIEQADAFVLWGSNMA